MTTRYPRTMSKNQLTPEQRPDRNGNIVTRWVKSSYNQVSKAVGIPRAAISKDEKYFLASESLDARVEQEVRQKKTLADQIEQLTTMEDALNCVDAYSDSPTAMTPERLKAYRSFRDVARSAGLTNGGRVSAQLQRAAGYVILNPHDGQLVENMIQRGIVDDDTILNVLSESKDAGVPDALHDGFL